MSAPGGPGERAGKKPGTVLTFVGETAQRLDPDPAHNRKVASLALALFDGLQDLHGYGESERVLLHIAARLHDIGWSAVVSGKHHKMSCRMILDLDLPGLDPQERLFCALIARYHTKSMPRPERHRRFASLDPRRREAVEWLAGILRVADGLDCDHSGNVRGVKPEVTQKAVTLRLEADGDCREALEGARKKGDLLVRKTGRPIQYRC